MKIAKLRILFLQLQYLYVEIREPLTGVISLVTKKCIVTRVTKIRKNHSHINDP